MRIWILFINLLMVGLIAPAWVGIMGGVVGQFSDSVTQIIVWAGPAIYVIISSYVIMFGGSEER